MKERLRHLCNPFLALVVWGGSTVRTLSVQDGDGAFGGAGGGGSGGSGTVVVWRRRRRRWWWLGVVRRFSA